MHNAHVYSPIFQDKSNGNIFKIPGRPHHGAFRQVKQGPGEGHHVGVTIFQST